MRILLTETGVKALQEPASGENEFSLLMRALQAGLTSNMLMLSPQDFESLKCYAASGEGEASERARRILDGATEG